MEQQELIEALDDLKHDLGKYLVLPLSMLEPNTDAENVRRALLQALRRTRSGPGGTWSADELWQAFWLEAGGALDAAAGGPAAEEAAAMTAAVTRALAWQAQLHGEAHPDLAAALADFRAVGRSIGALIAALQNPSDESGGAREVG